MAVSMKTQATRTPSCSWAAVVKGSFGQPEASSPTASRSAAAPAKPGPRGTRAWTCRGQVITMLNYYGWILPLQEIDHPGADHHEGRIYVKKSDVVAGAQLSPGDRVTFYLYEDDKGLGAEACCPEGWNVVPDFSLRSDAPEFVPWSLGDSRPPTLAADSRRCKGSDDFVDHDTDTDLLSSVNDDAPSWEDTDSDGGSDRLGSPLGAHPAPPGLEGEAPPRLVDFQPAHPMGYVQQIINLDGYEDCDEPASGEAHEEVSPALPLAKKESFLDSAPWRAVLPPPGLAPPAWAPPPGASAADWRHKLPWRRTSPTFE